MTFEEFQNHIQQLAKGIKASEFRADGIVAIARGGWMPARLLSSTLGIKKIYSYGVSYADKERTQLEIWSQPSPFLNNQSLLLVEDFLESGKSLVFVKEKLVQQGNTIKTFAVNYLEKSVLIPDFTIGQIETIPKLPWD